MVLLRYVLILRRLENERSAVAVVTGKVKYSFKSLSTSWSMPLYISRLFIAVAMVLTLVTSLMPEVLSKAVLNISGIMESCIYNFSRSNSSLMYICNEGGSDAVILSFENSKRVVSTSLIS